MFAMNPFAKRAEPAPPPPEELQPLELTSLDALIQPTFDQDQWTESQAEAHGQSGTSYANTAIAECQRCCFMPNSVNSAFFGEIF